MAFEGEPQDQLELSLQTFLRQHRINLEPGNYSIIISRNCGAYTLLINPLHKTLAEIKILLQSSQQIPRNFFKNACPVVHAILDPDGTLNFTKDLNGSANLLGEAIAYTSTQVLFVHSSRLLKEC